MPDLRPIWKRIATALVAQQEHMDFMVGPVADGAARQARAWSLWSAAWVTHNEGDGSRGYATRMFLRHAIGQGFDIDEISQEDEVARKWKDEAYVLEDEAAAAVAANEFDTSPDAMSRDAQVRMLGNIIMGQMGELFRAKGEAFAGGM
ncbi:uncharacterized protein LOC62_02G003330 [Vanrija pseudolonga]|uniref:Uncharacterized protein n=1 Tax=Vanrija pseudolonga TaxID=143232 RepID=A0AAF0Y8R3_9TREE|nr:hypothetical protein LOC62_02G003330 [Vanrija pseudolonga]